MEILEKIRKTIQDKLNNFEVDHYNENTYNYSQGYRRCLVDLLEELNYKKW